ncbi:MAG: hypothetical protein KF729_16920 [Sandaracinaceae bacterium]|nr:hypothetical protein [Sandaracinaceae bacterium]
MKPTLVFAFALLCFGCTSAAVPGDDAGEPAGLDAATEPDAGPSGEDAGFVSACPPGAPSPDAWDCASARPVSEGAAIEAEPLAWTWVGFEQAVCMNGSATGIGVSIHPEAEGLLILLEGGGACFDAVSCAGVANRDGYGEAKFASDAAGLLRRGILDRGDAANPFARWSFVYVPYCTGDVHGGQQPRAAGGRRHLGFQNVSWFLTRIVPTFRDAPRVVLAGRSAGGLGTIVNYPQVAEAFGCTPVHVLNDAGGLLTDEYMRPCLQRMVRDAWALDSAVPEDCEHCSCDDGGGLVNVLPYAAARYPDRRFAFVTSMEDTTMRTFFGYGYSPRCDFPQNMPGADYAAGLEGTRALLTAHPNFRTFYVAGERHTFTYQGLATSSVDGVTLASWLDQMLDGDTGWANVGP